MPGIILNPIANYNGIVGAQPEPPYVPSYSSLYLTGPDMYLYSGSNLYNNATRTGGIAKIPFANSGGLDNGWTTSVNSAGTGNTPYYTQWAAPMREYILMDWRITSASADYTSLQLVNKETSSVRYESTFTDTAGGMLGMTPARDESYILAYGEEFVQISSTDNCASGIAKLPYSTITSFATESVFDGNTGTGPNNHTSGGAAGQINDVFITPDGKIGVAHNGLGWNGNTSYNNFFTVLNEDGTIDSNFSASLNFLDNSDVFNTAGSVKKIYYFDNPTDNKKRWILSGTFKKVNGTSYNHIIALDETGSIDTTFSSGTGFNSTVRDIFKIDDDFMCVVGDFTTFNGSNNYHAIILRYDSAVLQGADNDNGVRIWTGVYHDNYLYFKGDFTQINADGITYNANGIFSVAQNFNTVNPNFDFTTGSAGGLLDASNNVSDENGLIFLG